MIKPEQVKVRAIACLKSVIRDVQVLQGQAEKLPDPTRGEPETKTDVLTACQAILTNAAWHLQVLTSRDS